MMKSMPIRPISLFAASSRPAAPILEQLSEGVIIAGTAGKLLFVNAAAERLHGVKTLDVAPDDYSETYHLFTLDGAPYPFGDLPLARAVTKGETVEDARWRIHRPDGSDIVAIGSARPLLEDGRQIGAILNVRDDTKRFAAEEKLRLSEERNRLILDAATDYAIFTTDNARVITNWSKGAAAIFGYSATEAIGYVLRHALDARGSRQRPARARSRRPRAPTAARMTSAGIQRADGGRVFLSGSVHPLPHDEQGRERGFIKIVRDETESRAIEDAVRESEARFRNMADNAPVMLWVTNEEGSCTYLSRSWYQFTGQTDIEGLGFGWLEAVHPDDRGWSTNVFLEANASHESFRLEYRLRHADGTYRWAIDAASPRFDEDGIFRGYVGSVVDIDDRKAIEQALSDKSDEFYALADNIPALAWMAYADGNIFWYNRRWYDYTATTAETQLGTGWEAVHDPDILPSVSRRWQASIETGDPFEMTFPLKGADGNYRPFLTRVIPIRDERGDIIRWFGTNVDISDQVEAERALSRLNETLEIRVAEEVARRSDAEEALRQSQKMETLGQLTGGIAHDFNNLLQIITGNLDILRRSIPADSPRLERSVDNAFKGAERAAVLTQRLLAFSRRQPLVPKVFDANKLVAGMSELLHRAIGETVAIETVLASGLWRVEADTNQLETALLNLAVNSRDAMPAGGKLTIETANTHLDHAYVDHHSGVAPGQYVAICVSDTGTGMDAATAERAFDPFFTTKEVGKGTGLGLSMVYGFVKQSGGHLKIYSEPDQGTTVKIYLPRHHGEEQEIEDAVRHGACPDQQRGRDDPGMRG